MVKLGHNSMLRQQSLGSTWTTWLHDCVCRQSVAVNEVVRGALGDTFETSVFAVVLLQVVFVHLEQLSVLL